MNNRRVVAITVTFNDYDFLCRALDALKKQTVPLDKIIVVDNCSIPELRTKLEAQRSGLIDVLFLTENLGGAGGFEAGMKHARENYSPDWYWLMDADAFPAPDCLELLLKHQKDYDSPGILAPLIFGTELQEYQLYHHKRLSRFLERDFNAYNAYDDIPEVSTIDADAFVGPLVSRIAVEDCGIADGGLFIYGDDLEYTYRVSRRYPVVLVKEAVIWHRDLQNDGTQKPTAWWKDYYMYRNRVLFIRKYSSSLLPKLAGIFLLFYRTSRHVLRSFKFAYPMKVTNILRACILKGFADGLMGRTGKTIDPVEFRQRIDKAASEK